MPQKTCRIPRSRVTTQHTPHDLVQPINRQKKYTRRNVHTIGGFRFVERQPTTSERLKRGWGCMRLHALGVLVHVLHAFDDLVRHLVLKLELELSV